MIQDVYIGTLLHYSISRLAGCRPELVLDQHRYMGDDSCRVSSGKNILLEI